MSNSWTLDHDNTLKEEHGNIQPKSDVEDPGSKSKILNDSDVSQSDKCCLRCCDPESRPWVAFIKLFFCCVAGVVFGWCMEKSRVFEPASIRLQMVFQRWIMLKMFLAAMASGQIVMAITSLIPWCKDRFRVAMESFAGCFTEKGIITSIIGPFILGMGMTLSGACPGMVLPQVGSWTKHSMYTFIGVLLGALVYGMIAPHIIKITKPKTPPKKLTFHDLVKTRYSVLALPMGVLIFVVVTLMEVYIPWDEDLDCWNRNYIATPDSSNVFTLKSWYPSASGATLGVLQVVIILAADDTLGGSSAYVTLVSQWVIGKRLQQVFPYLARARCGLGNWWQVFYVFCAVGGGAFSALASNSISTAQGVSIASAICGGFLLLLGARFAAGCTSGHGLSGMGLLYWYSFIAVPAMFAGGIALAFAMQATGALSSYDCHEPYCPPVYQIPSGNCTAFLAMT